MASARRIAAGGFIRRHTTFTLPTTFFLVLRLGCWELIVPFVESELLCSLLYERTYSGAITLGWHPFWNSILYAFFYWYIFQWQEDEISVNTETKNWCQIERYHLVVFCIGCYCFLTAKKMTKDSIQSSYILRKPQNFEEISKLVFNLLSNVKKSLEILSNLFAFQNIWTEFMIIEQESCKCANA